MLPISIGKIAAALLPLVILGYILGWMVSAVNAGWSIHPTLIALDGIGIALALWRCKDAV